MASTYEFRTLTARALWLPLIALFMVFAFAIWASRPATGWLMAMSFAVIIIVAQAFGAARREHRYWVTLFFYCLLHVVVLAFSAEAWIPKPTAAITPIFVLDYLVMAWAFPKISGLRFDLS